ncbi:hypothetical protein [Larkinella humicola]|uniref:GDSL-like lipase/acylhydrolase family protein n=1 Tax=Larkinella humicola TaxID=2607654 RepID=A0A5N1JF26_9BACT|nr:hypothetical protein [Larkinella humicola]KAA9353459.1 hypothetical protein F0P93_12490 [Larkinella humicola]
MKKIALAALVFCLFLLLVELAGRYYGLTNYPLYDASSEYEYLLKPNQDVRIYRNRFTTNEFSMRSAPIAKTDTLVVLLVGDSIINGGNSIDQDSLASTLVEKELLRKYGKKVRVLNISDKTWSPDNVVAYLKKFGVFGADMILMVANSGDAFDPMTFQPIVGVTSTHPDKNDAFAWPKLVVKAWATVEDRYFRSEEPATKEEKTAEKPENLVKGFADLDSIARQLNIPFFLYLHRSQSELTKNTVDRGGLVIEEFCQKNHIPMRINRMDFDMFNDEIHLNSKGQKALAKDLLPIIQSELKL